MPTHMKTVRNLAKLRHQPDKLRAVIQRLNKKQSQKALSFFNISLPAHYNTEHFRAALLSTINQHPWQWRIPPNKPRHPERVIDITGVPDYGPALRAIVRAHGIKIWDDNTNIQNLAKRYTLYENPTNRPQSRRNMKIHEFTEKKEFKRALKHLGEAGFRTHTYEVDGKYYIQTSHARAASRIVENVQTHTPDGYGSNR